jgi:transposase
MNTLSLSVWKPSSGKGNSLRTQPLLGAGNARVPRGMIQLAWRFLMFQKDSALAEWYRQRTANARGTRRP